MDKLKELPYRWNTISFIQCYWITMRPYLMFVSGITGLLGLSLTNLPVSLTVFYGLIFFLSYGFGQALTDCFQLDTDELSSPYRPLIKGLIGKNDVLIVSLTALTASGIVLTYANPLNSLLAAVAIGGLASYTYFKRKWWGGPFYNAWIVVALGLMGYLCSGISFTDLRATPYLFTIIMTIFFGYANFVLVGYFKDIEADAKTGYITFPIKFGRYISSWVSTLFASLMLIPPALVMMNNPQLETLLFFIAGTMLTVIAQCQIFKVKADDDAHRPIANVVHGYILTLSSLICFQKPSWFLSVLLFYLLFVLTLLNRPMREQI